MDKEIKPIALTPIKSSQIKGIGHDQETNTLAIQFNSGGIYHYEGVSEKQFDEFKSSKSIGKHFGEHIKKLPFTKLPVEKELVE
jgi:hypothetical protein